MKTVTLIIGIIIASNTCSQVNKFHGMELYTDTTVESLFLDNHRTIDEYSLGGYGVFKTPSRDYSVEKFTKQDFADVLKELERVLILNGRTLDSYDFVSIPGTVLTHLTADILYDAYSRGRLNVDYIYEYEVNGYEIYFSIDNVGTSKQIGISLGSTKDWELFMTDYNK